MDSGFVGVIVGAAIASIVPIIQIVVQHRQWKIDRKIDLLDNKRNREEALFNELLPEIERGLLEESWDAKSAAKLLAACPDKVAQPLFSYLKSKDDSAKNKQDALYHVSHRMHTHLAELEAEKLRVLGARTTNNNQGQALLRKKDRHC